MKRLLNIALDNAVALGVVVIVLFLIIPLPTFLLDFLLIVNIGLAIMILMITMNISEALEFSIFPSLLLVTTLFRLGLNVSSTRMILRDGYAGEVIQNFGQLITGGNIVIGVVIFLIIVLVQFIVITKGAERVAEVAARFTLDAMPGKQMAIDADLSSGLINEQEARARRQKIQKEADFYGAMDGATKIVKGDAVMSIVITLINFVGGVIIGMVMGGGDFATVLQTYSIVTIGDGLVSQLPALMISTATGMVVTRSVSEGSLNRDVIAQFKAQPRAMMTTGVILLFLGVIPNTPHAALIIGGGGLVGGGYLVKRSMERQKTIAAAAEGAAAQPEEAPPSESDYYKDINNVYSLLTVEPIEMEFGYSLIPMVDEGQGGKLISRIVIFRRQYAQDMGFVFPSIRLHDAASLGTNQYVIRIRGEEVARGEILVDYYLALEPANPLGEIDGIETVEPAYGIPSRWILPENREMAEVYGYTVIDPLSVMLTHLSETIKKYAYELLNRAETIQLVENLKQSSPELVEEAIPSVVSYATLEKVLRSLLKEGVPIKDLGTILETLVDALGQGRDVDAATEQVRGALARTITRRFCEDGQLRVVTLDAEVEKKIISSLTRNEQGVYLAMGPDLMQQIVTQMAEYLRKFNELSQTPVILVSQVIRGYFSKMITQFYPGVYVLSFNEVTSSVQIQAIGNIAMDTASRKAVGQ
ncbi:flagellar biosynthesis protein FlhA [Dysosmobacter sp. NSJ-60]|uniref:Flagellar biosynthesis protein FlhA n=1 Tax=Pusillibacter faecalis TaxID=2714358 RepID=A0A810Q949_9FIRM|nr:flagellar biosynthesis protein FlhA [Pusillibacter faecalis]MBC5747340.1 flagellar biosynthesis protein FlhA [Dysosmobacter hominis]MBS5658824.1 flagellar biosynthesis protein FlhA [Oscillibacter sp.]BCK84730.1 flagellar biosynthesis protein FlhA [Pusillibacter faecalis]